MFTSFQLGAMEPLNVIKCVFPVGQYFKFVFTETNHKSDTSIKQTLIPSSNGASFREIHLSRKWVNDFAVEKSDFGYAWMPNI